MINIQSLIDDAQCYETVREIRWTEGVRCPHCGSVEITKRGAMNGKKIASGMSAELVNASLMT